MRDVRARVLANVAVVLVAASASAAATGACTDDLEVAPAGDDAGGEGGSVDRASCPKDAPGDGETCLLPEGTTCTFGECATSIAQCSRGIWRYGANPSPKPPCPEPPPNAGARCPQCWPASVSCNYGSCSGEDASLARATAWCVSGEWAVDIQPCRDGGGADVQGDGEPDGD